jgi:peptidoglycan/xylan/chitin deacetylase (PgdA/CDA1 family)
VGGDTEFWWNEIERIVLGAEALPRSLDIDAAGARYRRSMASERAAVVPRGSTSSTWDITMPATSERQRVYLELREYILPLSSADRVTALESLRAQFGVVPLLRPSHRPLTADELRELGTGGTVEIGAHTRSHQMLAARTHDEQRDEVLGGKRALEQAGGREVRLFSYPYGTPDSFSEFSARLVREAGFLGAFTTRFGVTLPWTDRFRAPRCPTEDIGGAEFVKRLDRWFQMAR